MQKSVIFGTIPAKFNQGIMNSQMSRQIISQNQETQKKNKDVLPEIVEIDDGVMKSKIFYNPNVVQSNFISQPLKPDIEKARKIVPYREGFLFKLSPHFVQGYQKRFCRLQDRVLYYYTTTDDKNWNQLFGVLNFDIQTYEYSEEKNKDLVATFTLKPIGCDKIFKFKGESDAETTNWAMAVLEHLNSSKGKNNQIKNLSSIYRFWRTKSLSAEQVNETAQDGDIILFRTSDFCAKAQRAMTGAEYDHVALFYRDEQQLWVFEAVQSGVGTFKWSYMYTQGWHKFYEKVCIRRLENVNRTADFKQQLYNFISDNLGKSYSLNIAKFAKFQSCIRPQNQKEQKEMEERTYFCSELVAKTYKTLGLLPEVKSSTQYFPGNFSSQNQKLGLQMNANLSNEELIIFNNE